MVYELEAAVYIYKTEKQGFELWWIYIYTFYWHQYHFQENVCRNVPKNINIRQKSKLTSVLVNSIKKMLK